MPSISLLEAWQSGIITEEQYNTLIGNGAFPKVIVSVQDTISGNHTTFKVGVVSA